jgi:circadian clock protein KaiC
MKRISSGSAELDLVLGGGFPENSINILMGLPGTGKTILAEKVVFENATPDRPAYYLSTVSEPVDKMLRYLQGFDYYDPALLGEAVFYQDLGETLRSRGLKAFVDETIGIIKQHAPAFLVIDSFKALHAFADSPGDFRTRVSHLLTALSSFSVTTILVGEYSAHETAYLPEFAVADGIVELVLQKVGVKDIRYLRVVKQRGSTFFGGEHAFKISSSGIEVFPRLVTEASPMGYDLSRQREKTGVEMLDTMVADGFWKGSATVVFGPPGSGKTLLGLHYIFKGIEMGEKCLVATLQENPTQLQRIVAGFGWDLQEAIDSGMLELFYVSPVDIYIDEFVSTVARRVSEGGMSRVMIDSLNDLEASAPDKARFRDFMYAFVQTMAVEGISTYMTNEVKDLFATSIVTEFGISHMSDNVVLLHYVRQHSEIHRAISIIKTRASGHDRSIRRFDITPDGFVIGEPFDGIEFGPAHSV